MGPRIAALRADPSPRGEAEDRRGRGLVAPAGDLAALDARLEATNTTLAQVGISLRLERRGGRIGLRGPLPLRQGQGHRVQRLSLGLPATVQGLEAALAQLRLVAAQLEVGGFHWSDWSGGRACQAPPSRGGPAPTGAVESRSRRPTKTSGCGVEPAAATNALARRSGQGSTAPLGNPCPAAGEPAATPGRWGPFLPSRESRLAPLIAACESFERHFNQSPRRRHRAGSRSTWTAAYRPYLRRLLALVDVNAEHQLSGELLLRTLESYRPGSSGRQRCASALTALAEHQGIPLPSDWRERSGGYGLHAARFRRLPSDEQILKLVREIPNPGWRLAYGLMATYGLRNHEVFFCDLSSLSPGGDRVLRVLPSSKTGEHQVWPFQPEWVDWFELERLGHDPLALPPVARDLTRTTLRHAGRRVAEQFRRYDLPITPYDLRHAWAVRTIHIGLPDTVAARMMGHSVAIHTRTYHHWITRRDQQRAVDAALARRQPA
jgi:integrase